MVLGAGLALLALAIGIGGTHVKRDVLGSNSIAASEFVAVVGPGRVLCQTGESVPAGTGRLRLTIGTYGKPGPPLRVAVQDGGRQPLPVGSLAAGWNEGAIDIPLGGTTDRVVRSARVCIANRGDGRLAMAGAQRGARARIAGKAERGRVRIEYVAGDLRSSWSLASSMRARMTFARGLWDGVAPWAALLLILGGVAAAVRAILGAQPPGEERRAA